jgi:hypothetical protein
MLCRQSGDVGRILFVFAQDVFHRVDDDGLVGYLHGDFLAEFSVGFEFRLHCRSGRVLNRRVQVFGTVLRSLHNTKMPTDPGAPYANPRGFRKAPERPTLPE